MWLQRLANGVAYCRQQGPTGFTRHAANEASNALAERWLGVSTSGYATAAQLGVDDPDARAYAPIPYSVLYRLFRSLPIDWSSSTFIDYGCGKGRALAVAASFPFRRVLGIEIVGSLVETAQQNISRMKRRRATVVDVIQTDATHFDVPLDANVIYFYNPFGGAVLERVVANIRASLRKRPRRLCILYVNDDHFITLVLGQPWLACTQWLRFHPNLECGVYESRPEDPPLHSAR